MRRNLQYDTAELSPGPGTSSISSRSAAGEAGSSSSTTGTGSSTPSSNSVQWVQEGRIRYAEDIVDGLENAPAAFRRLFTGENTGKLIVKVGGRTGQQGEEDRRARSGRDGQRDRAGDRNGRVRDGLLRRRRRRADAGHEHVTTGRYGLERGVERGKLTREEADARARAPSFTLVRRSRRCRSGGRSGARAARAQAAGVPRPRLAPAPAGTILASNTSGFPIGAIAAATDAPTGDRLALGVAGAR